VKSEQNTSTSEVDNVSDDDDDDYGGLKFRITAGLKRLALLSFNNYILIELCKETNVRISANEYV
jgi:hypothetical protein